MGKDAENIPQSDENVCDFITHQSQWDIKCLKQVHNNHPVIQKIQGISIPIHEIEDVFYWGLNSSGELSTKSTTWATYVV